MLPPPGLGVSGRSMSRNPAAAAVCVSLYVETKRQKTSASVQINCRIYSATTIKDNYSVSQMTITYGSRK